MALTVLVILVRAPPASAQQGPERSRDRGEGVPLSMFGTYLEAGQFVFYPFFEYYRDNDFEYKPEELGYTDATDYRGRYRAREGLIFLAYGLSENVVVEFEAAMIAASLETAPQDNSGLPARLEQSGLGDVEGQIRWRLKKETASHPELFTYFEYVLPIQRKKLLIGTPDLELKLGLGVVRGFSWGTMTARAAVEQSAGVFSPGEFAVEYLKRVSNRLRVFAAIEGVQDEVSLITEAQVFLTPKIVLKMNTGIGLTSKAADWTPEIGVAFRIH
jgi:hypothetical protein